jgi:hypothetical protein
MEGGMPIYVAAAAKRERVLTITVVVGNLGPYAKNESFINYAVAQLCQAGVDPRWTPQNRPFVDTSKPAITDKAVPRR